MCRRNTQSREGESECKVEKRKFMSRSTDHPRPRNHRPPTTDGALGSTDTHRQHPLEPADGQGQNEVAGGCSADGNDVRRRRRRAGTMALGPCVGAFGLGITDGGRQSGGLCAFAGALQASRRPRHHSSLVSAAEGDCAMRKGDGGLGLHWRLKSRQNRAGPSNSLTLLVSRLKLRPHWGENHPISSRSTRPPPTIGYTSLALRKMQTTHARRLEEREGKDEGAVRRIPLPGHVCSNTLSHAPLVTTKLYPLLLQLLLLISP